MATAQKTLKKASNSDDFVGDPSLIIIDANLPLDEKWAKTFLLYAFSSTPSNWWYEKKLRKYRDMDKGIIDKMELKKYFDPSKNVTDEQRADLFRSNWTPCPLVSSLNLIIQNETVSLPVELRVTGSDKLSNDKKAEQKLRIKTRRAYIDIVNLVKSVTNDIPLNYDANIDKIGSGDESIDDGLDIIEDIKKEASTDWDFNLLQATGALKDGVEISHEQMIDYYFKSTKFNTNISDKIVSDFMKVNAFAYRFYTSTVNGLPMIQYIDLADVKTSRFDHRDGSDMDWWYFQYTCTWAEYMHMIGGSQTPEKNKEIYIKNRLSFFSNNPNHPEWSDTFTYPMLQSQMRLGYFEAKKHVYNSSTKKYYDTIKKFNYLPLTSGLTEDYILGLSDLVDMYRYGTNLQNADFSLVVYRDDSRQSFYDVQEPDYLRLNLIYNQYLNTFSAFSPEGVGFAIETIEELADQIMAEEEELMKRQGQDITNLSLQKIREDIIRNYVLTGRGIFKMRKGDNHEERLDRPTFVLENKVLTNCTQLIQQMFMVFSQMKMSLGIPESRLGQDPKPRQTLQGTQMATESSYYSTKSIGDAYKYALESFGQRMLYYNQQVITEFNDNGEPTTERAKEMKALIGVKGTTWLEVYKDMPYQRCILNVVNKPSEQEKTRLVALTARYEELGKVPATTSLIVEEIPNYKLAKLFVVFSQRRQDRINTENAMELAKQQGEQTQQAFAMQQQAQAASKEQDAQMESRILTLENALKTQGQLDVKDKTNQNRLQENAQKSDLDIQREAAKKAMETL